MLRSSRIHGPALLLLALLLGGCASAPRVHEAAPGEVIASTALAQVGRPYLYGGFTPEGFDCSGLVRYAYLAAGFTVPRTTEDQYSAARRISLRKLEPGDLLFFRIGSREVSHVAIYAGERRFVHAPKTGKPVETKSLDDPYYRDRLVSAGRLY
ncbi:MAG: C40 family peptidase [Pseudomonadota bacterium]